MCGSKSPARAGIEVRTKTLGGAYALLEETDRDGSARGLF